MREEWRLNQILGERIRGLRMGRHLSQVKLAEQLGVTFQQLQKIEKGINRVSAARLFQIAEILEVPVERFYEELL